MSGEEDKRSNRVAKIEGAYPIHNNIKVKTDFKRTEKR